MPSIPHANRAKLHAALWRARVTVAACALLGLAACSCAPHGPRRYLVISHSALDRLTFFDLDRREVVGVLPSQKLPHDMLLSPDHATLYLVNSGAQCISTYALDSPELWRTARAFMAGDTARRGPGMSPGHAAPASNRGASDMNPDTRPDRASGPVAVRELPASIVQHHLTEPEFPPEAQAAHERAGALTHNACGDCHARSVGGKPFAPAFVDDDRVIRLVHLHSRNITELDARTLAVTRQIPLPIPEHMSPIEAWTEPGTTTTFVTCRDSIGTSRRGLVAVVDLANGARLASITPGIYPWHLLPSPDGRRLYVNNFQSSRITVIDVATRTVVDSLMAENGPAFMRWADNGTLLVSCFYTHRVLAIDVAGRAVTRRIEVGSNPTMMLPGDTPGTLWVLCGGESALQLIELSTGKVLETHPLLFGAYAMQLVTNARGGS